MLLVLGLLACQPAAAPPPGVHVEVLAASSLADALPEVARAWREETGHEATFTFDSTSRLAKQVEAGLPADVFVSADVEWMTWLADHGLVRPDTRRDLLGNDLVVVVPHDASFVPLDPHDLADPRLDRLALGGEGVPAGRYGRAALESAGVWAAVEPRAVYGENARNVLWWVASGEASAGVVYATDARSEPRVRTAFTFPPSSHPPIVYPAAVTTSSSHPDEAAAFVAYCVSPGARATFEAAGFRVPSP